MTSSHVDHNNLLLLGPICQSPPQPSCVAQSRKPPLSFFWVEGEPER